MMRWRSLLPLVALAVAACQGRAKAGDGPYAADVAEDVPKIEHALGVKFKTPPKLETRDRAQVRDFLLARVRDSSTQKQIATQEAVYKLLGMLPDTLHLGDLAVRLYTEQVMGYYDPKTKVLYVAKDAPDAYRGLTILHELVHALQDQYANLDSLEAIADDDDRVTAVQAVIEGQATYESTLIAAGGTGNVAAQMPGGWESIRSSIREAIGTQPVFSSAPMVIRESAMFPYINGSDFVRRFKAHEPGKLPFDKLPVSTEQLMHDDAYFGKTPDVPSEITLPKIAGTVATNNLGEFGTRLFIYRFTSDQDRSIRASNGWDGDRYALVKTPAGNALVWATVWDSPVDAGEFVSAVDAVIAHRFNVKPRVTGERRHFDAGKRSIDVVGSEISGRSVVLYVDAPAEAAGSLDVSQILKQIKVTPR